MTIACLKGFGKMPFLRDKLTSFVKEGRRMSIHCFTICVGHGSREQVFEGASLINLKPLVVKHLVDFVLQDICQKLLEGCSEIAGSQLEQKSLLSRSLVVKPGSQVDVNDAEESLLDSPVNGIAFS